MYEKLAFAYIAAAGIIGTAVLLIELYFAINMAIDKLAHKRKPMATPMSPDEILRNRLKRSVQYRIDTIRNAN
jgi:hypothetical protein